MHLKLMWCPRLPFRAISSELLQLQRNTELSFSGVLVKAYLEGILVMTLRVVGDTRNTFVKQQLSPAQLAKLKQFLQQCVIAKALHAKHVTGLVVLHETLQVPMPGVYNALYPIVVFEYFEVRSARRMKSTQRGVKLTLAGCTDPLLSVFFSTGESGVQLLTLSARIGWSPPASVAKQLHSTLHYLSPEQTGRIGRIVDWRTDICSLGGQC